MVERRPKPFSLFMIGEPNAENEDVAKKEGVLRKKEKSQERGLRKKILRKSKFTRKRRREKRFSTIYHRDNM